MPWALREYPSASPLETPRDSSRVLHYAIDATAGDRKANTKNSHTLARGVWDPAGVPPQRGEVVERPRFPPRRLEGCRR